MCVCVCMYTSQIFSENELEHSFSFISFYLRLKIRTRLKFLFTQSWSLILLIVLLAPPLFFKLLFNFLSNSTLELFSRQFLFRRTWHSYECITPGIQCIRMHTDPQNLNSTTYFFYFSVGDNFLSV